MHGREDNSRINKQIVEANTRLVDENKELKEKFEKVVDYLREHKPVCSTAVLMNILLDGDDND